MKQKNTAMILMVPETKKPVVGSCQPSRTEANKHGSDRENPQCLKPLPSNEYVKTAD
jgi:hypothetical protein